MRARCCLALHLFHALISTTNHQLSAPITNNDRLHQSLLPPLPVTRQSPHPITYRRAAAGVHSYEVAYRYAISVISLTSFPERCCHKLMVHPMFSACSAELVQIAFYSIAAFPVAYNVAYRRMLIPVFK